MRNSFADSFYAAAKEDERQCMVVADISPAGSMERFRQDFPRRFVNTGVAEQIMIGVAAGMAMRGLRPWAYTIATFAMFRPYEFIRCDLAYQQLPVTVVGVGGGVTYSQLGGTHHAMEDVAVACAMPGMRVIAPCDPYETAEATRWCAAQEGGPVYLRLGKAGEPVLGGSGPVRGCDYCERAAWYGEINCGHTGQSWEFGKLRKLRDGHDAIIGYGPILKLAMDAVPDATIYSCHTLKPLDRAGITNMLREHGSVLVLEEATRWLGDQVRALAWDAVEVHDYLYGLRTLSLRDDFQHTYGTHADVLKAHGLTAERIREALNG
jgi:transketolase